MGYILFEVYVITQLLRGFEFKNILKYGQEVASKKVVFCKVRR